MQATKDILPSPQKVPKPLKYLVHLPSTAEIEAELARLRATPPTLPDMLLRQEAKLADARRRDEIATTRPVGCWCLGLGGDDERTVLGGDRYYIKTCSCPEGVAANEHKLEVKKLAGDQKEHHRIDTLWANAQIPARFVDMRLDTSPLAKANPALIERLRPPKDIFSDNPDWENLPDSVTAPYFAALDAWWGASYFIYGPFGVGKTGLAVGLARERVEWPDGECGDKFLSTLMFVSTPRMLSELRSTYNRSGAEDMPTEQVVIDKYARADLLILDDLGAEYIKSTDWVGDRLYQIIGERHDELRPTIFTSNLTMDALAKRIGERITWRIVEMVGKNILHLPGPNLRA